MKTYALEMMLATLMVTCGIVLLSPGDTFALPHYSIMKTVIGEVPGGVLLAGVGTMRWAAILRNGGSRYTPLWRIAGCMVGAGFWFTLSVALETSLLDDNLVEPGPPMLLAVSATAFMFEVFAALRGGADANTLDSLRLREARSKVGNYGEKRS